MVRSSPSDTLTSMTPVSFVDDSSTLEHRVPRRSPWDISKWLEGTSGQRALSTTDTSTYTGSYVDDGADMLLPNPRLPMPGLGNVSEKFYDRGKKGKDEARWTDAMAKAVGGDIQRSLAKMKRYDAIRVVDREQGAKEKKKEAPNKSNGTMSEGEVDEGGAVRMKLPPTWHDFIIECPDGRVILVDKDGTYDSRLPGKHVVDSGSSKKEKEELRQREREQERQKRREEKKRKEETAAKVSPKANAHSHKASRDERSRDHSHREQRRDHRSSHSTRSSSNTKPLAPIPEVDRSDPGSHVVSDVSSMINYCVTGHRNQRHSQVSSLSKRPTPPSAGPEHGNWTSPAPSSVKPTSNVDWGSNHEANSQTDVDRDIWKQDEAWESPKLRMKANSGVPSSKSTKSISSYHSSTRTPTELHQGEETQFPPLTPVRSPTKSVTFEPGCYVPNVEDFYTYITPETVRYHGPSSARSYGSWDTHTATDYTSTTSSARPRAPPTQTLITIDENWTASIATRSRSSAQTSSAMSSVYTASHVPIVEEAGAITKHHAASDHESQAPNVQPYSWRRDEEDESTHSTAGSTEPASISALDTEADPWQKDNQETGAWTDENVKSVKSTTSTYHHPTVEDVPETSEDEAQEWTAATSEWSSAAAVGFSHGAAEGAGGVTTTWTGSSGDWPPQRVDSGYDEDNETWLNTEVGGVKFREAEWRRSGAMS